MSSPRNSVEQHSSKSRRGLAARPVKFPFNSRTRSFLTRSRGHEVGCTLARLKTNCARLARHLHNALVLFSLNFGQMVTADSLGFLYRIGPLKGTKR
jgi:hypothetical protein